MRRTFTLILVLFFLVSSAFKRVPLKWPVLKKQQTVKYDGKASYYANKFHGRKTSSGEIFRNDSLTAAHKTLPFGTFVKVINVRNDSVVIVKINDRLPAQSKRLIDLSQRAGKQLNMIRQGIVPVKLEILHPADSNQL